MIICYSNIEAVKMAEVERMHKNPVIKVGTGGLWLLWKEGTMLCKSYGKRSCGTFLECKECGILIKNYK